MPQSSPKMAPKAQFDIRKDLPWTKIKNKCSRLSSTFDQEPPFQRYMLTNKILTKKWPKNDISSLEGKYPRPKSKKKCSPLSSIFDVERTFQRCLPPSEILPKGWVATAKLKKIQEGLVRFGCNLGQLIAYLCRL